MGPHRQLPAVRGADVGSRGRVDALLARVVERERDLEGLKAELRDLQATYFAQVGDLYARLYDLDDRIAIVERALGLRPPADASGAHEPASPEDDPAAAAGPGAGGCANRLAPSADLKRVFRDLAKAIHPDRAADDAARFRRHSLMAEANRAYADRDEDRLRLILQAWQGGPGDSQPAGVRDAGTSADRQAADLEARLIAIDVEFADLRASAIGRLKTKVDDARAQGWDLCAEIVREVTREVARATARLAALERRAVASGVPGSSRPRP